MNSVPLSKTILGTHVAATSYDHAARQIAHWAAAGESRYVCVCNVHMIMEAHDDPQVHRAVNAADLVTPDGMPVVWALRTLGVRNATRVDGAGLITRVLEEAARLKLPVALYGGTEQSTNAFRQFATRHYPGIELTPTILPPFRPLTDGEDADFTRQLVVAGARIVFVSLGCPKQEKWMADHRGRVPAVLIGVGAAIDFHAGTIPRAPSWMQRVGLEWLFRLCQEPRRLWKRYLIHNPRFVALFLRQLLARRAPSSGH
jgi:N-acetylglucosaminyldiphosphoundecaprenol N-acetyl-beta-D-mannosaminyltransferase